ncbi:MAG: cbb3-type cytochrome c oxidase subunit 3 [Sulfuriflexus sp.]|nr:cbb3-type cytochrome c oxidase subunit 3 [Sulfuriflexus sp.]
MEYMNSIQMLWTIVAFVTFVGIVIWAWSSKREDEFHEAENLIFEEDNTERSHVNKQSQLGTKHHV